MMAPASSTPESLATVVQVAASSLSDVGVQRLEQRTFGQLGNSPRVLVLMTDNRPPAPRQYQGVAAVVNEAYAARHGYDFVYWRVPAFNATDVAQRFGVAPPLPPPVPNVKFLPVAYHPGLERYRSAPWARLLAFWNVTTTAARGAYDVVLFTDSDAVLGNHNMTVAAFLAAAAATPRLPPGRAFGVPAPNASMLFYGNIPYAMSNYPVTGFVAWVPGPATRALITAWWNVDARRFDFRHAFEQFGLWHLMSAVGFGRADVCVHNAGQMAYGDPTGLVRHFGSDRAAERLPQLTEIARRWVPGVETDDRLAARIRAVAARAVVQWDALELAARVAAEPGAVPSGTIADTDNPGDFEWGRVGSWE